MLPRQSLGKAQFDSLLNKTYEIKNPGDPTEILRVLNWLRLGLMKGDSRRTDGQIIMRIVQCVLFVFRGGNSPLQSSIY